MKILLWAIFPDGLRQLPTNILSVALSAVWINQTRQSQYFKKIGLLAHLSGKRGFTPGPPRSSASATPDCQMACDWILTHVKVWMKVFITYLILLDLERTPYVQWEFYSLYSSKHGFEERFWEDKLLCLMIHSRSSHFHKNSRTTKTLKWNILHIKQIVYEV